MNTFSNIFFLSCIIGWANFEPPRGQDFIKFLGSYNGNTGLEPITPLIDFKKILRKRKEEGAQQPL